MAQDSGVQNLSKPQEVDLDEIEVTILLLGKNANTLNQAASFLTRRGWPASVQTNISKAVEFVAEKKPDFVLVSLSHPNQAVFKLPDLVTQTFNLTCVVFTEGPDASSMQRLNNFKARYKVQGQPSGPNLHRTIRRILAEKFNIATEPTERETGRRERTEVDAGTETGRETSSAMVQSADRPKQKGAVMIKGESPSAPGNAGDGRGALHFSGPSTGAEGPEGYRPQANDEGTETVSTGKYTMTKKTRKSLKDLMGAAAAGDLLEGVPQGGMPQGTGNSAESQAALLGKLKQSLFGDGEANAEASQASSTSASEAYYANASKTKPSPPPSFAFDRPSQGGAGGGPEPQGVPDLPNLSPEQLAALPPKALIERAVTSALIKICRPNPDTITRELGTLAKVAMFPIESAATPGYLILGLHQDPDQIEDFFLKRCEAALREEFEAIKVPAQIEDGFWVHIPDVQFRTWLNEETAFCLVVPHENSEVGIGYLPLENALPRAQEHGPNKDMLAVKIEDISTDEPINFKAYLYLQRNDKYFLYLRNGRRLQHEQKARLKNRQIDNIYMKSVDAGNVRMFFAAAYLRTRIKKAG